MAEQLRVIGPTGLNRAIPLAVSVAAGAVLAVQVVALLAGGDVDRLALLPPALLLIAGVVVLRRRVAVEPEALEVRNFLVPVRIERHGIDRILVQCPPRSAARIVVIRGDGTAVDLLVTRSGSYGDAELQRHLAWLQDWHLALSRTPWPPPVVGRPVDIPPPTRGGTLTP